jgi:ribosomal protein L24E
MRIIKPGNNPDAEIWTGTCSNCGAIIEATRGELDVKHDQRDGSYAWSDCPDCKRIVSVCFHPVKE